MITVTLINKKINNMGGNFPDGNFLGESFPGGDDSPGGSLTGGYSPVGSFPDTDTPLALERKFSCFESGERSLINLTLQAFSFFFLFLASLVSKSFKFFCFDLLQNQSFIL